jgi:hypothetical protein
MSRSLRRAVEGWNNGIVEGWDVGVWDGELME